jgi:hypothetical protein
MLYEAPGLTSNFLKEWWSSIFCNAHHLNFMRHRFCIVWFSPFNYVQTKNVKKLPIGESEAVNRRTNNSMTNKKRRNNDLQTIMQKIWTSYKTKWSKHDPNIVFTRKSKRTSRHGTDNVTKCYLTTWRCSGRVGSSYSFNGIRHVTFCKPGDKSWMRTGPDFDYDKRNITLSPHIRRGINIVFW